MTATRRDIVKPFAAVPVVSLLPTTASAAASPVSAAGSETVTDADLAAYKATYDATMEACVQSSTTRSASRPRFVR